MRIVISTCNKYDHLIKGCCMLLNKYWPNQDITIVCSRPIVGLPDNVQLFLCASDAEAWTTRMRNYLTQQADPYFVFLFDDYWLTAPVDVERVTALEGCVLHGAVKGDLSANTAYFKHTTYKHNPELVVAAQDAHYRASTQPAIWTKAYMLGLFKANWNPWQFELNAPAGNDGAIIIGPRSQIYVYANVYYKGACDPYMLAKIADADLNELATTGAMEGMPTVVELQRLRANS